MAPCLHGNKKERRRRSFFLFYRKFIKKTRADIVGWYNVKEKTGRAPLALCPHTDVMQPQAAAKPCSAARSIAAAGRKRRVRFNRNPNRRLLRTVRRPERSAAC